MSIVRLELRVQEETRNFIDKYHKKHSLPTRNKAFDHLVRKFEENEEKAVSYFQMMQKEIKAADKARAELAKYKQRHQAVYSDLERMKNTIDEFKEVVI